MRKASVTSAKSAPRSWTRRYLSFEFGHSFSRASEKSAAAAITSSGVRDVVAEVVTSSTGAIVGEKLGVCARAVPRPAEQDKAGDEAHSAHDRPERAPGHRRPLDEGGALTDPDKTGQAEQGSYDTPQDDHRRTLRPITAAGLPAGTLQQAQPARATRTSSKYAPARRPVRRLTCRRSRASS